MHSFLYLSNILLCLCTTIPLFIGQSPLSASGHLGCFRVLAIVHSAAMNNGIHVSFQFWFPQGLRLGVGFLGHMVGYSYF